MRKNFVSSYRIKHAICVILGICAALFLTDSVVTRRNMAVEAAMSKTQKELAQEVFRFHVLAHSDSEKDQEIKLKVRDRIIAYMRTELEAEPRAKASAAKTKKWAASHLPKLKEIAENVVKEEGGAYGAEAEVVNCYFPDKRYGDVLFPEGDYEALRISLGAAKGHNWWCVLYPNLCFTDVSCTAVSDEGKEELKEVLTEEEYEMVTAASDFKIKCFFFGDIFEEK